MLRKWLTNWLSRHRNRTSFALHMVGIPAAFVAAPVTALMKYWVLAAGLFFGGYALQFIGHMIEGNRSGEEELVRRLLRKR